MNRYLLIESHDPFESNEVSYFYNLAAGLAKGGNEVTLFLVQNGWLDIAIDQLAEGCNALWH
jgi:hypothetical protein